MRKVDGIALVAGVAGALFLAACASGGAANGAGGGTPAVHASRNRLPRARRLDRTPIAELQYSGGVPAPGARAQRFLSISVEIAEDGRPDMSTLRITGPGASENRSQIEGWIQAGQYECLDKAGHPVRGLYRLDIRLAIGRM